MIPIVKADGTVELEFIRQLKKRSGEVDEKVNQPWLKSSPRSRKEETRPLGNTP